MLYQYLLDDVARKRLNPQQNKQRQQQPGSRDEYVESPSGELVRSPRTNESTNFGLFRARSAPRGKKAFHYPLNVVQKGSPCEQIEDESLPSSPQLPDFAVTRTGKSEVKRGNARLTM